MCCVFFKKKIKKNHSRIISIKKNQTIIKFIINKKFLLFLFKTEKTATIGKHRKNSFDFNNNPQLRGISCHHQKSSDFSLHIERYAIQH